MKNQFPLSFWLLLLLAILPACAASAETSLTAETLPNQADLTIEVATAATVEAATEEPSTPLPAGATAMPGGFTTAAYNDPLPIFEPLTGGGDDVPNPEPCQDYLTGGGPKALEFVEPPAVRVLNFNICVLGMEIVADNTFTVTMESPDGEVYEAEYLFEQDGAAVAPALQASDESRSYGWAIDYYDVPITIIPVDFTAGLASGSWVITVRDSTGTFDQWTTALITHREQALDLTPDWPPSPFRWRSYSLNIAPGKPAHIAGANYPPGTGIVIAMYSTDGTPLYATRIITDGEGAFHTTFEAGADLTTGRYLLRVAIEPDAITEEWERFLFVQE
jgi:hypothetical protein